MEGTFTAQTKNGHSLIHDSVYEVLANHYGNKNQEQMLEYMSSNFVAKRITIGKNSDTTNRLCIVLEKEHYSMLAERLLKDLLSLELHDVFMNDALKDDDVCETFLEVLKRKPYQEVKTIFFSKQNDTSKIVSKSKNVGNEVESKRLSDCELDRQKLLVGEMMVAESDSHSDTVHTVRAISWVIYYGHSKILQGLFNTILENKESINHVIGWNSFSNNEVEDESAITVDLSEQTRLLTLSCFSGELEVVRLLLQYCDAKCINNKLQYTCHMFYDHRYITPLTAACAHGHKSVVEELIKHGASIDQQDEWGVTALYVAAESGHLPVVETLIEAGANFNECDLDGISPLFASAQFGHSSVVESLLKHGSNYNKPDIYKMSPLYVASRAGHTSVVDALIKYGADCNLSDLDHRTPLYIASKSGHLSIVKALIENGANINACDVDGKSPLFVALQQDRKSVAEILAEHGAMKIP
jgi:ankyrin repeat protein